MTIMYEIRANGGCQWVIYRGEAPGRTRLGRPRFTQRPQYVGSVEAGKIDDSGQWIGDEDDVLIAATSGDFPVIPNDRHPVYVDGVRVR